MKVGDKIYCYNSTRDTITVGKTYIIQKIDQGSFNSKSFKYINFFSDVDEYIGLPIRPEGEEDCEDNKYISFFDRVFKSPKEIREMKLNKLKKLK